MTVTSLETLMTRLIAGTETIVAPSEVFARYWRWFLVSSGRFDAIADDRIISWDSMKARWIRRDGEETAANRALRWMFASDLCAPDRAQSFPSLLPSLADGLQSSVQLLAL